MLLGRDPRSHQWNVIENLEFADYDSLEDSCRDYAWLITHGSPYHEAWEAYKENGNIGAFLVAISRVYATDPHYEALVLAVAKQPNLLNAIGQARQSAAT